MSLILSQLAKIATDIPNAVAVSDKYQRLSWSVLMTEVGRLASKLQPYQNKVVALAADNQIEWLLMDLACLQAGVILLPLPGFFTSRQQQHAMQQSGAVGLVVTGDNAEQANMPLTDRLYLKPFINTQPSAIPEGTVKITFTSGSTGQPKGVCLSEANQLNVARALLQRTHLSKARHLCVLPLPTLLENIAGVYGPLLSGGEVILLPAADLGFNGSSGFDVSALTRVLDQKKPDSLILLPALLSALIIHIKQGWQPPASLKFVAVGGSRVGAGLLQAAKQVGLPVYEGYGLSECSSVVSLNTPDMNQVGAAGKILPHLNVTIEEGEVVVSGNSFLGYVNDRDSWFKDRVYTGDLGLIDEDGYLHIHGRRKNLLISSYGRNINPEWIESELLANPAIDQCVVLGDARPFCIALIHLRNDAISDQAIDNWIDQINAELPDYARVRHWIRLPEALSPQTGTLTSNGKPVRTEIENLYKSDIDNLYKEQA